MRHIASLLLLAILILGVIPNNVCTAAPAARPAKNITLYAHSDSEATAVGGRTLSAAPVAGVKNTADATKLVSFTLYPALVASLHIIGTLAVDVWLQSGQNVAGRLYVAVSEVLIDGTVVQLRSANVSATVRQLRPSGMTFGFGGVNYTLSRGSTIRLDTQFKPTVQTSVLLLWDDPATPTSVTIEVEDTISLGIQILGKQNRPSMVFPTNETDHAAHLLAKVDVVDVFGTHDIRNVTLNVSNGTGFSIVSEAPMTLVGEDPAVGSYIFEQGFTAPAGRYLVSVTATDTSNNSYASSSQFLVTEFFPTTILVSDLDGKPVRDAAVSILLNSTLVDSGRTDDEGSVDLSAPSSNEVGTFSITMEYRGAITELADRMSIRGHDLVRLEAPLSDWTIFVRYQTFGLAVSEATVRVEEGNVTVALGKTGPDGSVTLEQMAAGAYTIVVESALVTYQAAYEHSHDKRTAYVEIPFHFAVPLQAWLGILAIALASTFGIYAVRRSRSKRPRPFGYFGTLLGGALPSTGITMISGSPGSGKTQMIYNLMSEMIAPDRPAIFVTNVEFPSKVRAALKRLGTDAEALEKRGSLRFVDCYAGSAGVQSSETHHVSSQTDLTALGVQISSCFAEVGGKGDVYLDSITPTVVDGAFEKALSFVRYYGARVKAENSSFLYTISSSMELEALAKFEDEADCVIQLDLYESAGVTKRRMKVKKARGLSHYQDWVDFRVNPRGKIEFLPG